MRDESSLTWLECWQMVQKIFVSAFGTQKAINQFRLTNQIGTFLREGREIKKISIPMMSERMKVADDVIRSLELGMYTSYQLWSMRQLIEFGYGVDLAWIIQEAQHHVQIEFGYVVEFNI